MTKRNFRLSLVLLAALLLPSPGLLGQQVQTPAAWTEFLAWFKASPGMTDPGKVFAAYTEKLKADGLSEAQIAERMTLLRNAVREHSTDLTAVHFDKIYASPTPPFKAEASAYLVRAIADRRPGAALDVGMGQGRNALHLASRGWQVTGYDVSEGGLAAARALASSRGLSLNAVRATHDDFDFGVERWDLVVMTYAQAPMQDERFLKRVRDSLKPGGIVVVEQFNAPPDNPSNKGPANALFKSFEGLRVIHYEDIVDRSEWGSALCRLGRITAQKD